MEAAILTRECARRAERLGPFDERAFERECDAVLAVVAWLWREQRRAKAEEDSYVASNPMADVVALRFAFDRWSGKIGLIEDTHGHVELAVSDRGVRPDRRLAASTEDFQELALGSHPCLSFSVVERTNGLDRGCIFGSAFDSNGSLPCSRKKFHRIEH